MHLFLLLKTKYVALSSLVNDDHSTRYKQQDTFNQRKEQRMIYDSMTLAAMIIIFKQKLSVVSKRLIQLIKLTVDNRLEPTMLNLGPDVVSLLILNLVVLNLRSFK